MNFAQKLRRYPQNMNNQYTGNVIEPEYIQTKAPENNVLDPEVRSFIELKGKYEKDTIRVDKMRRVEDDYEYLEKLQNDLDTSKRPKVKSSMLFFALNSFDSDIINLPKIAPTGNVLQATDRNLIDAIREEIFEDSGMDEVWSDILYSFKAEGTAIVQLGFDGDDSVIPIEKCDLAELYFDSKLPKLAGKNVRTGKMVKTIIREVVMSYSEFVSKFPDHEGWVMVGSPTSAVQSLLDNQTVFKDGQVDQNGDVHVFYCYSIAKEKNPVMLVFAGGTAAIIDRKAGKEYPFYEVMPNGKRRPYLPFVDFHFSNVRRGFYSMSILGMLKDISESYEKGFNAILPVFHKAVNPIVMLFGNSDERINEEIQIASELQALGDTPIISIGSENVDMKTLTPGEGVFSALEQLRIVSLRDATQRFGINFQALEEVEQSATEFVGKTKATAVAKNAIYKINARGLSRLAKLITQLAILYWKSDDSRLVKFDITEDGTISEAIPMGELLILLKEMTFDFDVETDIRIPMSTQDKDQAMQEMENSVRLLFYNTPFQSVEEIMPEIEALYARAVFRNMDNIYTKKRLVDKANIIINARTQAIAPEQNTSSPQEGQPIEKQLSQDIKKELAPQTFLSQANLNSNE